MAPTRRQIRSVILELLAERGTSTTCPSEVARRLSATAWRELMAPVREVAADLQEKGVVDAYQRGSPVKVATARGPIRLRLREVSRIDYRAQPHRYRVGRGEMGVLTVEPYKSELLPLWRFATATLASRSSKALYEKFVEYQRAHDFVGMDMARKFLQMGWTRARRYANHPTGRKYERGTRRVIETSAHDGEKARSAAIFKEVYDRVRTDAAYLEAKRQHRSQ